MSVPFPIYEVSYEAEQTQEDMGTKPKFWFEHPEMGKCLFKQARPNTGEDWSEKIAAELARLLGLPHARQELAVWNDNPGTISPLMMSQDDYLIHGNDILTGIVSNYPREQRYNVSEHTLDAVVQAVSDPEVQKPYDWQPPEGIETAIDTFIGYLLLNAWIGNGDRHHENWGFIEAISQGTHLSPTYDHASCLGRELLDPKRQQYLQNNHVGKYIGKSMSAFYARVGDRKPLPTLLAFQRSAVFSPKAGAIWLSRLEEITDEMTSSLFNKIPSQRMSTTAVTFAQQVLIMNKERLQRKSLESPS